MKRSWVLTNGIGPNKGSKFRRNAKKWKHSHMSKNVWKSKGHFQNIEVELPILELEIVRCFESLDWGLGIKPCSNWALFKILKNSWKIFPKTRIYIWRAMNYQIAKLIPNNLIIHQKNQISIDLKVRYIVENLFWMATTFQLKVLKLGAKWKSYEPPKWCDS
jgi:hypothetical protein